MYPWRRHVFHHKNPARGCERGSHDLVWPGAAWGHALQSCSPGPAYAAHERRQGVCRWSHRLRQGGSGRPGTGGEPGAHSVPIIAGGPVPGERCCVRCNLEGTVAEHPGGDSDGEFQRRSPSYKYSKPGESDSRHQPGRSGSDLSHSWFGGGVSLAGRQLASAETGTEWSNISGPGLGVGGGGVAGRCSAANRFRRPTNQGSV